MGSSSKPDHFLRTQDLSLITVSVIEENQDYSGKSVLYGYLVISIGNYGFSFNFVDSIYFSDTKVYLFVKTLFLFWLLCFI